MATNASIADAICSSTELYLPTFAFDLMPENLFGVCSEKGSCEFAVIGSEVIAGCVCDDGWTGRSDFIDSSGLACGVNEYAIKALWGANILLLAVTLFQTRNDVLAKREQHNTVVQTKAQQSKKYGIWDNKGYAAILVFVLGCAPVTILLGLVRIFKDDERVGLTALNTTLFALAKLFFYLTAFLFQPSLLQTILKGSKAQKKLVGLARGWGLVNLILSVGLGFLPFVTLIFSDTGRDSVAQNVYVAYMAGQMLTMFVFFSQSVLIERKFLEIMDSTATGTKSDKSEEIKRKLLVFQHGLKIQAGAQFIIYGIFLSVRAFLVSFLGTTVPWYWYSVLFQFQTEFLTACMRFSTTHSFPCSTPSTTTGCQSHGK